MKKENTAKRLKQLMSDRNLRQVDILNLTKPYCEKYSVKMNKSDISQYVSGKTEPSQDKLVILGMALHVNEPWLMGYDVPMERNNYEDQTVLRVDTELEDACTLLENAGYLLASNDDNDIIIKNTFGDIITCVHDYELVNKYESLLRKGFLSAQALAEVDFALLEDQKESRKEFARQWNIQYFEAKMLESFSILTDENKKKSIAYTENLLANQKLEEELLPAAAHNDSSNDPDQQRLMAEDIDEL